MSHGAMRFLELGYYIYIPTKLLCSNNFLT